MAPKPRPLEDGPERWRWIAEADRETREAHPNFYWFHHYDEEPRYFWDKVEISEEEYQANVDQGALDPPPEKPKDIT